MNFKTPWKSLRKNSIAKWTEKEESREISAQYVHLIFRKRIVSCNLFFKQISLSESDGTVIMRIYLFRISWKWAIQVLIDVPYYRLCNYRSMRFLPWDLVWTECTLVIFSAMLQSVSTLFSYSRIHSVSAFCSLSFIWLDAVERFSQLQERFQTQTSDGLVRFSDFLTMFVDQRQR